MAGSLADIISFNAALSAMANAGEWQQAKLNCCSSVFFGSWKEDVENGLWMLWGSFQPKEIKGGVAGQVKKN